MMIRAGHNDPFQKRHKHLLIFCTLTGLKIRAVDRIVSSTWMRFLLNSWSIFMHLILCSTVTISVLQLLLIKQTSIYAAIHQVMLIGVSTHGAIRQFYMCKNIDKFDDLYTAWDDLFGQDDDWKSRQKSVDAYYKDAKKVILTLGFITTITFAFFCGSIFLSPNKTLQFQTIIPYRRQSPDFEILISYFTTRILLYAIAVPSSQMLLVLPILWELGETSRLMKSLKEIFQACETITERVTIRNGETMIVKTYSNRGIANVDRKLKIWVEQHQKLAKFHQMSMVLNNFELGMEMIATFVEVCGTAILCSSDYYGPVVQFSVLAGFMGNVALFYYTCKKCNDLSDLSRDVADYAFAENWCSLPLKMKKSFLMIIATTQKPLNYYGVYIFRLDVRTFQKIFQTAYSVFNFFFTIVHNKGLIP